MEMKIGVLIMFQNNNPYRILVFFFYVLLSDYPINSPGEIHLVNLRKSVSMSLSSSCMSSASLVSDPIHRSSFHQVSNYPLTI